MINIDLCHIQLIKGLIRASKPSTVLEIGFGTGLTTSAILDSLDKNKKGSLVLVDNFSDWGGTSPAHYEPLKKQWDAHPGRLGFLRSSEESFIKNCDCTFDFIISDADHCNTHKWKEETYALLNPGGILVYHDVSNPDYPNLRSIMEIPGKLFNTSSLPGEECERGLYVIFKP